MEENINIIDLHLADLKAQREIHGNDHPIVANTLNIIGLHHHHVTGDQEAALEYHYEALGILMRAPQDSETNQAMEVAITHTDIGNAHKLRGDGDAALAAYADALVMFRASGISDDHPRVEATLRFITHIDNYWKGESVMTKKATSKDQAPDGACYLSSSFL
mmetsp:Transcript_553/g.705  ORF Transcript_553/g.705 Transcript_553/m.705 type:complete len:162 (+) Transcript_553:97-582(+)